jgi:opacity protein-like surface antigen
MNLERSKFCLLFLALAGANAASAQSISGNRANTWEFTMQANYLGSENVTFDGGASADINSDVGFGFGGAYNFNEHFAMRADLMWNSSDYTAMRVLDTGSVGSPGTKTGNRGFNSSLDSATLALGADFYFVDAMVSPFLGVSAGWTYIDTNIPSGPAQTACWWDPWYGYICDGYQPSIDDTEFSYGAAAGLRVDLSDNVFLRATIGANYVDYGKGADSDNYTVSTLGIGFSY